MGDVGILAASAGKMPALQDLGYFMSITDN